jgi:hypothetical protein
MGLENSHNYCASSKLKDHLRATKDALQVCALGPPFPAAILGNLRDGCSRKFYRFHSPLSIFLFNCICSHIIELFRLSLSFRFMIMKQPPLEAFEAWLNQKQQLQLLF